MLDAKEQIGAHTTADLLFSYVLYFVCVYVINAETRAGIVLIVATE